MKRLMVIFVTLVLALTAFAGCVQAEEALPTLRVAVIPVISSVAIPYIAEQGWDVENGFKIETVVFSSGAPMGEALLSNEWDIGIMSAAGVYAAANYDALCIADTSDTIGVDGIGVFVRPDSDIAAVKGSNPTYPNVLGDAETVKGKTILCPTGTLSQMHVLMWLEAIGLTDEDVNLVHMEFTQAYQAFKSGQGDVVALNPPFCYQAADEGYLSAAPTAELGVGLNDMDFANKKTYDENKDIIKTCLELILKADAEMEADPNVKKQALADWYAANGSTVDESSLDQEITKRLYTIDDLKAMEEPVGDTLINVSEFYATIGNIETEQVEVVKNNIDGSLIGEILAAN